ncbi:MAG: prepilin-type N-terminal cleavage/methylation domain-containing protein, partial [bacterium]
MLNRIRQSKSESTGLKAAGFTIIEVMIVLAIAGIIMAIVFLAIPAIQRSNRNTQRKSDASRLGGLVAE